MRSTSTLLPFALLAFSTACGGSDATGGASTSTSAGDGGAGGGQTSGGAGGKMEGPGADTVVTPFTNTPLYFTGTDNQREVDATASFPATGTYEKITLHLALTCPSGGCDPYDRIGSLGVVTAKDPAGDTVIELQRFITPFGVGASWDLDVTDLRPLLAGDITLRAFIDTWVGPGSSGGAGWVLTASFEMKGGTPAKVPVAVVPVYTRRRVVYGDPTRSIDSQAPATPVALPAGASSYSLRSFVTGHGQGNADNCGEFCQKDHTFTAGGKAHQQSVWRTDCATSGAPDQQGTFAYSRSGWCPGADVKPWEIDVTADVSASSSTVGYSVETYENTCRPDSATCTGCTLGTGCEYDDGAHTEPGFELSTVLIGYR